MGLQDVMAGAWEWLSGGISAEEQGDVAGERKTSVLPSILTPYNPMGRAGLRVMPKPTPANLRRFAETPVVRRAINVVKGRIAGMDWQIRVRRGYAADAVENATERMNALRFCLEEPNASDSFRVLWEQVLEDLLVGGFGAIEMEATGDDARPFRMWAVDGATIQIDTKWARRSPTSLAMPRATGRMRAKEVDGSSPR